MSRFTIVLEVNDKQMADYCACDGPDDPEFSAEAEIRDMLEENEEPKCLGIKLISIKEEK